MLLLSKPELATLSFERSVRLLFLLRAAGGHRRDGTDSGRNHANPAERDGSATRVNVVSSLRQARAKWQTESRFEVRDELRRDVV